MPAVGHPLSSLSRDKSGAEPNEKEKHAREHACTRNDETESRERKTGRRKPKWMRQGDYRPIWYPPPSPLALVVCCLACL